MTSTSYTVINCKGKGAIRYWGSGGVLISLPFLWAHSWIDHLSVLRMARIMPDLRLHSQPQSVTALWPPLPNYTAWRTEAHVYENLLKVVTWQCHGSESILGPFGHQSGLLPFHTKPHQTW